MEYFMQHQLDMMLVLIGALGVLAFFMLFTKILSKRRRRALLAMAFSSVLLLLADREAHIFRGDTSTAGYYMVRICNFLVYFLMLFDIYSFNIYLADIFTENRDEKEMPVGLKVSKLLLLAGMLLVVISQFTGLYYTFDDQNRYQRSDSFFILSYIIPFVILVIQHITIIKHRRLLSRRIQISLHLFTIVPILASIAQVKLYGLSLTTTTMVWMVIVLYLFALFDMNDKVEKARRLEIEYLKKEKEQLREFLKQTSLAFAKTIDMKDEYTNGHSFRVAQYTAELARELGYDEDTVEQYAYVALLHDIGKIGIPDEVLNKPDKLTDEEFEIIKSHTTLGYNVLKDISLLPEIADGAGFHHERPDGKGYPKGLKGEEIPRIAQIVAVADTFDAMYSNRKYRSRMNFEKAVSIIRDAAGTQLTEDVVEAFLRLVEQGKLRAPDDDGGGNMTEIDNVK